MIRFRQPLKYVRVIVLYSLAAVLSGAACAPASEGESDTVAVENSSWIVKEALVFGENDNTIIGTMMVFDHGRFFCVDPRGDLDKFDVAFSTRGELLGFRFRAVDGRHGAGLVNTHEKGKLTAFINHFNGPKEAVIEPKAERGKCDVMFECVELTTEEARERLARFGINLGDD